MGTMVYSEILDTRNVTLSKDNATSVMRYKVYKDPATATEQELHEMLDPFEVLSDASFPPIGTYHPVIYGCVVKTIDIIPNTETTNRCIVQLNFGMITGNGNGGGGDNSTPNEHGETWTWNMVSQSTSINMVKSDEKADGKPLPRQMTYDGESPKGARKHTAINFDEENVYGTEVYRPAGTLNVTRVYTSISEVGKSYRKIIRSLQNTINDAQWPENSEYEAGELLFLGADISYNLAEGTATINYSFQCGVTQFDQSFEVWKKDSTEDSVSVNIEVIRPFQTVWAPVDRRVHKETSKSHTRLGSVNVADVYESGDFSQLKLLGDA